MNRNKNRRKKGVILTAAVMSMALIFTLMGCGGQSLTSKDSTVADFQSQTLDGEDVTNDIFSGSELTMVNIWATYCGPCIEEMPDLGEISRSYDKSQFQIVGIVSDVTKPNDATAEKIIKETKADYTHIIDSKSLEKGLLSSLDAVPTTVFVDKNGNILGDPYIGSRSKSDWEGSIDKLLKSNSKGETTSAETTKSGEEASTVAQVASEDVVMGGCPSCHRFSSNLKRIQEQENAE